MHAILGNCICLKCSLQNGKTYINQNIAGVVIIIIILIIITTTIITTTTIIIMIMVIAIAITIGIMLVVQPLRIRLRWNEELKWDTYRVLCQFWDKREDTCCTPGERNLECLSVCIATHTWFQRPLDTWEYTKSVFQIQKWATNNSPWRFNFKLLSGNGEGLDVSLFGSAEQDSATQLCTRLAVWQHPPHARRNADVAVTLLVFDFQGTLSSAYNTIVTEYNIRQYSTQ